MEDKIVNYVEKMLDVDLNNSCAQNHPRFYVVLELGKGWIDKLLIAGLDGLDVEVVIIYDHHIVRYWLCMSLDHKVKDYLNLTRCHKGVSTKIGAKNHVR